MTNTLPTWFVAQLFFGCSLLRGNINSNGNNNMETTRMVTLIFRNANNTTEIQGHRNNIALFQKFSDQISQKN